MNDRWFNGLTTPSSSERLISGCNYTGFWQQV